GVRGDEKSLGVGSRRGIKAPRDLTHILAANRVDRWQSMSKAGVISSLQSEKPSRGVLKGEQRRFGIARPEIAGELPFDIEGAGPSGPGGGEGPSGQGREPGKSGGDGIQRSGAELGIVQKRRGHIDHGGASAKYQQLGFCQSEGEAERRRKVGFIA